MRGPAEIGVLGEPGVVEPEMGEERVEEEEEQTEEGREEEAEVGAE